jgi:hypothetical protein
MRTILPTGNSGLPSPRPHTKRPEFSMISILSADLDVLDEEETLNFFHPREMEKNQKGPPLCYVIFLKSAFQPNLKYS